MAKARVFAEMPSRERYQRLQRIKQRCHLDEDCGCWVWRGGGNPNGLPVVSITLDGEEMTVSGRRWTYFLKTGHKFQPGEVVSVPCEHAGCLNPSHLELVTIAAVRKKVANTALGIAQRKAAGRARAKKLDWDKVRVIRGSDKPLSQLAREFGVSKSAIEKVRAGHNWAEASPFAGLFTGLAANESARRAA